MKKIVFLIILVLTSSYTFSNDSYLNEIRYKYHHDFYENKVRFERYIEETNILDFNFDLFEEKMDEVEKKLEIAKEIYEAESTPPYTYEGNSVLYSANTDFPRARDPKMYLEKTKKLKELIPYYKKLKEAESVYKNRVIDRDGDDIAEIYKQRMYYAFDAFVDRDENATAAKEAAEREWQLYLLDRPFAKMYDELISDLNTINENIESGQKKKFDKKDLETIKVKIEEIKNHLGNKAGSSYNDSLDYLYDILRQEEENPYYTPKEIMEQFVSLSKINKKTETGEFVDTDSLVDTNNRFKAKEIYDKYIRGRKEKIKLEEERKRAEEERKRLEAERKELNSLIQSINKLDKTQSDLSEYIDEKGAYAYLSTKDIVLGYNKELNEFTKTGSFVKYSKDKSSLAGLIKYKNISAVLRFNKNKEEDKWVNSQIEGYLRYNKNFELDNEYSLDTYASTLLSYNTAFEKGNYNVGSKMTNIFDVGANFKYNNLDKNYSVSFLNNLEYISNGEREITNKNTLDKKSINQENKLSYKFGVKTEKVVDKYKFGAKITLDTDFNLETRLNFGYTF